MPAKARTAPDMLEYALLTPAELAAVTRVATGRDLAAPTWRAAPIPYDWGAPATAGLWRIDVHDGVSQEHPVTSYFVKLLRNTRLWPGLQNMPDDATREDFVSYFPWRAELDFYESRIGSVLPPGMRAPQLHHVKYADPDYIALWWEFIDERPGGWALADYRRAAHLLGRLAARRRAGAAVNRALPLIARDRQSYGSALRYYTQRRVLHGVLPSLQDGRLWSHPVLATALRRAEEPDLPAQLLALGARIPRLLDMLDSLPQTYAHGDASPQNLLLPVSDPGTVVVIDWGFGTLLPVGFDLGQLLTGLASAGQTDPSELAAIDEVILPAYLQGLAVEGYESDEGVIRLGYVGGLAARSALCTLPLELLASGECTEETVELFATRLRLARVLVDMAAEIPA